MIKITWELTVALQIWYGETEKTTEEVVRKETFSNIIWSHAPKIISKTVNKKVKLTPYANVKKKVNR